MKKLLSFLLVAVMMLAMVSFASAEGFSGEIKIWVADAVVDFTKEQIDNFSAAHPEYSGYTYVVEAVGEGDAVITEELTPETSDEDLMAALESFQEDCISYAK